MLTENEIAQSNEEILIFLSNLSILIGIGAFIIFLSIYINKRRTNNNQWLLILSLGSLLYVVFVISNLIGFILCTFSLYLIFRNINKTDAQKVISPLFTVIKVASIVILIVYVCNSNGVRHIWKINISNREDKIGTDVKAKKKDPLNKLDKMFNKNGSDIANCPSRSIHYKIQYPYKCPSCSYIGKQK